MRDAAIALVLKRPCPGMVVALLACELKENDT